RWWCQMRQVLIVANQTVGSEALAAAVRTRMAAGPCKFVLLVPATERTLFEVPGNPPMRGVTSPAEAFDTARNRLRSGLGWLHHLGAATAEGEMGDKNPMHAIRTSL